MTVVERLVGEVAQRAGWQVLPVADAAWEALPEPPEDLVTFARLCGGLRTPTGLVIAHRIRHAQRALLGEEYPDDRSFHWYVLAETDTTATAERVVIDFHPNRLGRCYEAFWDRFGVAGSMPVVATSFTDFLRRTADAGGTVFWADHAVRWGDAYDD